MPRIAAIKRKDLIRYLKKMGFEGPYSGGRHEYLVKGELKLWIPNPHQGDISPDLLDRILKQAGISKAEWTKLR